MDDQMLLAANGGGGGGMDWITALLAGIPAVITTVGAVFGIDDDDARAEREAERKLQHQQMVLEQQRLEQIASAKRSREMIFLVGGLVVVGGATYMVIRRK